jgi:hypothetical protein
MEHLIRKIRRYIPAAGAFADGESAAMPAAARLRRVASTKWGTRRCLEMRQLQEMGLETITA